MPERTIYIMTAIVVAWALILGLLVGGLVITTYRQRKSKSSRCWSCHDPDHPCLCFYCFRMLFVSASLTGIIAWLIK